MSGNILRSPERQMAYKAALAAFSEACVRAGLTQVETVILAAEFTGMSVAACQITTAHEAQLSVAAGAMRNGYKKRIIGGAAPAVFGRS